MTFLHPPELLELDQLAGLAGSRLERRLLCEVVLGEQRLPVHAFVLGTDRSETPAVGIFGGVHGLERIGAEVAIAYLRSLVMRLRWDETLHRQLDMVRLVFVPVVNPGGLVRGTRANPNGVDLMRNAPVDCGERVPALIGGQRISASLPWYRGALGSAMQPEAEALCRIVREELTHRPFSIAVDCHSGFGLHDRVWFPLAHTARHLPEVYALCETMDGRAGPDIGSSQDSTTLRSSEQRLDASPTRRLLCNPNHFRETLNEESFDHCCRRRHHELRRRCPCGS